MMENHEWQERLSPVSAQAPGGAEPPSGIALCLSGGGYRAMLFHAGALWRLNELGFLSRLARVSSVSGGSIIAAVLGMNWGKLDFDASGVARRFEAAVLEPVRRMAAETIDTASVLGGIFGFGTAAGRIRKAYERTLFGGATLQDLPDTPRFVINATNVQSKALWRFSKPYMRDYRVGEVRNPRVSLALAVSASSAFPPFLSPVELKLNPEEFTPSTGQDLQFEPYTRRVLLTDGGVYDNLGLETAWKRCRTILVSDGGGDVPEEPEPSTGWVRHTYRVLTLIDGQVGALRKRLLIASYRMGLREGAYWGIRSDIENYQAPGALPCPVAETMALARTPTRLKALDAATQQRIINWGYAICDAAIRKHVTREAPAPSGFPYPESGLGGG
jgi:NTE family protein